MTRLVCALGPDCAGTLVHRFVGDATTRLDVAMYEVGPSYGWLLPRAQGRGVRVRVLLDGHGGANRGCLEELRRAEEKGTRVPCRVRPHHGLREAHWKLLVADSGRVAVGTGNLIARDAPADRGGRLPPASQPLTGTREWWAFVDGAPSLARLARAHISAAWRTAVPPPPVWAVEEAGTPPPVGSPRPEVAPVTIELAAQRLRLAADAREVRSLIEAALDPQLRRCLLTVPYVHTWAPPVRALVDRLAEQRRAGADVRVLLGSPPAAADAGTLRERDIPVRVMDPARCTTGHAKGLVTDGSVLVMSANWSAAGLDASLESALAIDHPAAAGYFGDAFERDWEVSDEA